MIPLLVLMLSERRKLIYPIHCKRSRNLTKMLLSLSLSKSYREGNGHKSPKGPEKQKAVRPEGTPPAISKPAAPAGLTKEEPWKTGHGQKWRTAQDPSKKRPSAQPGGPTPSVTVTPSPPGDRVPNSAQQKHTPIHRKKDEDLTGKPGLRQDKKRKTLSRRMKLSLLNLWEREHLKEEDQRKVIEMRKETMAQRAKGGYLPLTQEEINLYKQQMIEKYEMQKRENDLLLMKRRQENSKATPEKPPTSPSTVGFHRSTRTPVTPKNETTTTATTTIPASATQPTTPTATVNFAGETSSHPSDCRQNDL